ncbi:Xaa-Pro dipeptidase [Anoxybacter fermentans]|uniref:Xaa-Pro dipeptidase n=1 Tax=Anoxybacter fermentans TaxID=1323375 RepID=A0A3Q9HQS5_9FIRM|nr:Xaa-Pro peptidase family protein [Anoxybacter fermentans]AZR73559.1 Xaa-Pro dipeptidase [Anoxybacter fermentans]
MKQRVERLKKLFTAKGLDGVLITKAENRRYITGFTGSAGVGIITEDRNILVTDFRYLEQAAEQAPDFEIVDGTMDIVVKVQEVVNELKIKKLGFESQGMTFFDYQQYINQIGDIAELVPLDGLVEELRLIKDEEEIEMIKKAAEIADAAFEHIQSFIKPGVTEVEVALELEYFMKKMGSQKNAFDFIIASGPRSSLPHGVASDRVIQSGEFLKMDFGAVYNGYHSDITRTVVVGEPNEKMIEIYNIVKEAQQSVLDQIKAGMTTKEADAIARNIIAEAGYGSNFGHGLGHGIGLEIHEGPRVSFKEEVILKENMVITVEPGIYIPQWGGVRIEDDVVITKDGCRVLTSATKELIKL